jgi:hypothetical protein
MNGRAGTQLATTLLVVVLAAGCGASTPATSTGSPGTGPSSSGTVTVTPEPGPTLTPEQAIAAYGLGPTRDPSVTYQPDVVLVEGGPSIIRWASDDAMTWAIDRNAPGAADLAVGKIMFATSVAMGRVAEIEDQGDERIVTIVPVGLTDLVRDADIQIDQDLDLAAASYHQLPAGVPAIFPDDTPSASPSPSAAADTDVPDGATLVTLPTVRLATYRSAPLAAGSTPDDRLTFPIKACPELGIGDWSVEPCVDRTGITLTVDRKLDQHLKLGGVLKLPITKLHFRSGTTIRDGQIVSSGGVLEGIEGIDISLSGGVGNGAQDNVKFKIEIPMEVETASIVVGGIPWKMLIEAKFTVETAFTGRNSTLSAHGSYALDGPIGIEDGKPLVPVLTVRSSILDSLSGITVGASGVVFAAKFKYHGGIGVYGLVVGPYLTLTVSVGLGQGSVIGAPLAECKGATLGVWIGVGGGFSANPARLAWLLGQRFATSKYTLKLEDDLAQVQVIDRRAVRPDVPLCRG